MSDSINMRALHPLTYRALEDLCDRRDWEPFYPYMQPGNVAYLAACLKFIPDSDKTFPKGKWTTIQRLQEMVDERAKEVADG